MTYSDYLDLEIIASRKGILPSKELEKREKDKERQKRCHEQNKGYRTEQSKRWRETHKGYYTNARKDRSEYFREYYRRKKAMEKDKDTL